MNIPISILIALLKTGVMAVAVNILTFVLCIDADFGYGPESAVGFLFLTTFVLLFAVFGIFAVVFLPISLIDKKALEEKSLFELGERYMIIVSFLIAIGLLFVGAIMAEAMHEDFLTTGVSMVGFYVTLFSGLMIYINELKQRMTPEIPHANPTSTTV